MSERIRFDENGFTAIATAAAREAIEQYKRSQKRGRKDEGRGSKIVGEATRIWREKHGLSVTELAVESGLHPTTIGKIEAGKRGMGLRTFAQLSYVLGPGYTDKVLTLVRE